jgi:hypothetical protein
MAKMTKTQQKRAYAAILQKAGNLWRARGLGQYGAYRMSTKDYLAIERIVDKYLKKF